MLADVVLGKLGLVKALFHHDKNGFFYALDRTNGKFLYGEPIVPGINLGFRPRSRDRAPQGEPAMIAKRAAPRSGPIIPEPRGIDRLAAFSLQPGPQHPLLHVQPMGDGLQVLGRKTSSSRRPTANGIWAPIISNT